VLVTLICHFFNSLLCWCYFSILQMKVTAVCYATFDEHTHSFTPGIQPIPVSQILPTVDSLLPSGLTPWTICHPDCIFWAILFFFVLSSFPYFSAFRQLLAVHINISYHIIICTSSPRPKWKDLIPMTIIILSNETYHRHFANKPFEVINGVDTPLDRGRFVVVHLYSALSVRC